MDRYLRAVRRIVQGPASAQWHALILTTKGIIPDNGGIGNQMVQRPCRHSCAHARRRRQGARCDQGP
jgi:hypothetical protein